jgi:hypothetical protein
VQPTGPEIRFPFCLESNNTSSSSCGCGSRSIRKLACTGQDTILLHPVLGPYNVSAIDYTGSSMKLNPLVEPCMALQKKLIVSRSSSSPQLDDINDNLLVHFYRSTSIICCTREFTPGAADRIAGPVSCLSNTTHFLYFVAGYEDMSLLPLECKVVLVSDGLYGRIPTYIFDNPIVGRYQQSQSFKESAEIILSFAESLNQSLKMADYYLFSTIHL